MMTKTGREKTARALRRIQKCNGDCKHCEHLQIPCSGNYYAFVCGIADKAGYTPLSDTMANVKAEAIECLTFELS